jgi:hypothetical protein
MKLHDANDMQDRARRMNFFSLDPSMSFRGNGGAETQDPWICLSVCHDDRVSLRQCHAFPKREKRIQVKDRMLIHRDQGETST